ncbi:1-acyl-sn-glycerol-3-phosphate acyltransferase [Nigerium massiliense]|uniref:1-acyl-sn-glycerol-3-phosphate acyltransferase n=1 Tax=Nigerium massiliense TaxID=1522317 RepID=UPI0006950CB7|nr:1-acyl-sn-glycerol-3-phosphate acyltransferase [Nigerium massiliense]
MPRHDPDHGALRTVALSDAASALAPRPGLARAAATAVLLPFALRFRRELEEADARVGTDGLAAAADVLLPGYGGRPMFCGADRVPADGPLLVVANHPGTVDTPLLWRLLATRRDLLLIALDRPLLRALPNLSARTLYVGDGVGARGGLVRAASAHLRAGGALVTFPAGTIEPDPSLRPADALAALGEWSRSPELFARLAPGTVVLPVAIAGVLSERWLGHPLARRFADTDARELAAAALQLVRRDRSITPRVVVGEPLSGDPHGLTGRLEDAMRGLICAGDGRRPASTHRPDG